MYSDSGTVEYNKDKMNENNEMTTNSGRINRLSRCAENAKVGDRDWKMIVVERWNF